MIMYTCNVSRARAAKGTTRKVLDHRCSRVSFVGLQQALRRRTQRDVARHGLFGLGVPEIAVIAGVAALIFGPSKLPELGKAAGQTAKSFQDAAKEFNEELKKGLEEGETKASGDTKIESDQAAKPAENEKKPEPVEKTKD
eukprot:jgi/Ulvmu1/4981/UM207_0025.1